MKRIEFWISPVFFTDFNKQQSFQIELPLIQHYAPEAFLYNAWGMEANGLLNFINGKIHDSPYVPKSLHQTGCQVTDQGFQVPDRSWFMVYKGRFVKRIDA